MVWSGRQEGQLISIDAVVLAPPQVTLTVPVPSVIAAPIDQDHDTLPVPSAFFVPRPKADTTAPLAVVNVSVQLALG